MDVVSLSLETLIQIVTVILSCLYLHDRELSLKNPTFGDQLRKSVTKCEHNICMTSACIL